MLDSLYRKCEWFRCCSRYWEQARLQILDLGCNSSAIIFSSWELRPGAQRCCHFPSEAACAQLATNYRMSSYSYYLFIGTVTEADATTDRHAAKMSQTGWQGRGPVRINQMQPDRQDAENIDPKAQPKHAHTVFFITSCCSAFCFVFSWIIFCEIFSTWVRKCAWKLAVLASISRLVKTGSITHREVLSCCYVNMLGSLCLSQRL